MHADDFAHVARVAAGEHPRHGNRVRFGKLEDAAVTREQVVVVERER